MTVPSPIAELRHAPESPTPPGGTKTTERRLRKLRRARAVKVFTGLIAIVLMIIPLMILHHLKSDTEQQESRRLLPTIISSWVGK
jgi:hypothetical protein